MEEIQQVRTRSSSDLKRVIQLTRFARWIMRHWLGIGLGFFLLFNVGAWSAPVFMRLGFTDVGRGVYLLYAPFCHQMAQRSFFLFGPKLMYTPEELPVNTGGTRADTLIMRNFRGSPELGWKVAWSDRMVYMYGSLWLSAFIIGLVSRWREVKPLPIWVFLLLLLPMVLDGTTHLLSDLGGLFEGFRYNNAWLATLTNHAFSEAFYRGDQLGSFNSWMRLSSGISFGVGCVWFAFPYILRASRQSTAKLDQQLARGS